MDKNNSKDLSNHSSHRKLSEMIHGYRITQLIYVAAKLGIADLLKDGPKSCEELARVTGSHAPSLYRILRALASIGIFAEEDGSFKLTDLAIPLQTNIPGSIRSVAIMRGDECNWKPWGELLYGVKTGQSPFEKVFNMELFQYYENNLEAAKAFNEGMSTFSQRDIDILLEIYDFTPFKKIVDIGGGHGLLLSSILNKYSDAIGILFDLPSVVEGTKALLDSRGLTKRCQIIGGNFFEFIPEGGEIYILKKIIHDWDDEHAIAILKNCRQGMLKNSKLLLIEMVVQPKEYESPAKINDIHMMVVTPGGRERTEEEFHKLLTASGFKMENLISTKSTSYIIEGVPV